MSKDNQNFAIYCGDDSTVFIELDVADGSPFNPANCTFEWWAGKSPYSDALIQKALGAGITVVQGGCNLELDDTDTINLRPGYYYHELKAFLADGTRTVALTGTMRLRAALDMSDRSRQAAASFGGSGRLK